MEHENWETKAFFPFGKPLKEIGRAYPIIKFTRKPPLRNSGRVDETPKEIQTSHKKKTLKGNGIHNKFIAIQ